MAGTIFSAIDKKLDNSLQLVPEGNYAADNGVVRTDFFDVGNRVLFNHQGRQVIWTPSAMKFVDENGVEDVIFTVQDVPLEVRGNIARFNRSMPDIDDWFEQTNDRIKHNIIVQGFQRDPMPWLEGKIDFVIGGRLEYDSDLRVRINDLTGIVGGFETSGEIEVVNEDGMVIFTLPQITVFDSAIPERTSTTGRYRATSSLDGILEFDIIVDNSWMAADSRAYPVVIDPTIIANPSKDNANYVNKGIAELSNGWLVTMLFNTGSPNQFIFFKSTDKGATWSQLCFITTALYGSMVAEGNIIKFACANSVSSQVVVKYVEFDASTVTPATDLASSLVTVYTDTTRSQSGATDIVSSNGIITIAYMAGSSTYAVFTSRSTDNGVTWSAPTRRDNTSIILNALRMDALGTTVALAWTNQQGASGGNIIYFTFFDGTNWGAVNSWNLSVSMSNGMIALRIKKSGANIGRIFLATVPLQNHYLYYSDNNGAGSNGSGFSLISVPTGRSNPNIAEDIDGNIHLVYGLPTAGVARRSVANGTTAVGAETVISAAGTQPNVMPRQVSNVIGVNWIESSQNMFDKIVVDHPPNAPSLGTMLNFNASQAAVFPWTFSDPDGGDTQTAYQLQIIKVSDGSVVYDSGKVVSATQTHTVPAGTVANGQQYQWKVRTWDFFDSVGAYSALGTFWTSAPPSTTVTNPASDSASVITPTLIAQWSFSDPEGDGQSAYQVKLTSSSDAMLWDSGKVADSVSRSVAIQYSLKNGISYKVKVTVWDAKGIPSAESVRTFLVSFIPPAAPNIFSATGSGLIAVTVSNPVPSGGQPVVHSNDIYRRMQGEATWIRIATNIPVNGSFSDYGAASGVTYEYRARAIGVDGTVSDGTTDSNTITFGGIWLHDVSDPEGTLHQFRFGGRDRSTNWEADVSLLKYAGRRRAVAQFGEQENGSIAPTLEMITGSPDYDLLCSLIYQKGTYCYRDGRGRKMFGVIPRLPISDEVFGYSVSIEMTETDYTEEV